MLRNQRGFLPILLILVLLGVVAFVAYLFYRPMRTIAELLQENKKLREAITNITKEEQIGYAKVIKQYELGGKKKTTLRFVETDRTDPTKKILEKRYSIEGDVVHFDALVVKFRNPVVMDGREKSLYLWRRVYGEYTPPIKGHSIENQGQEPRRYADMCAKLSLKDRETFWKGIWDLSNSPDALAKPNVKAIEGKVVYRQLRPKLIYVFKIDGSGNVTAEVVPEM